MMNIMDIKGYKAQISYLDEIQHFRGEFIGLNGGADFYADNVQDLRLEGEKSLAVFLSVCEEQGIEPYKQFSGKFNIRISPSLHAAAVTAASAENLSLNEWVSQTLQAKLA